MSNNETLTSSENKRAKLAGWKSLPAWQPLPASHLPLNPPMEPAEIGKQAACQQEKKGQTGNLKK